MATTRSLPKAVVVGACLALLACPRSARQQTVDVRPAENRQSWRVRSHAEDAGLTESHMFQVAVDESGTAWLATSNGLYAYHGYVWLRYGTEHGLPSDYVRSVTVTRNGRVWVGTDRGAGVFDREEFVFLAPPDQLAGPSVRRIVEGPGGELWFCCDRWPEAEVSGGLTRHTPGVWEHWGVDDGLPSDYVSDVFVASDQRVFVLTRSGLAELQDGRFRQPLVEARLAGADDYFWSMVETAPGELLVSTSSGYFAHDGTDWSRALEHRYGVNYPALLRTHDGQVLCLRQTNPATFVRWTGEGWEDATEPFEWDGHSVQHLAESSDGAVWAVGGGAVQRWDRRAASHLVYEGLPPPRLVDEHGEPWFADETRVLRRSGDTWQRFPGASGFVERDPSGGVWMGHGNGLARWTRAAGYRTHADLPGHLQLEHLLGVDGLGAPWVLARAADGRAVAGWMDERWRVVSLGAQPLASLRACADPIDGGLWVLLAEYRSGNRLLYVAPDGSVSERGLPAQVLVAEAPHVVRTSDGALWLHGFFGLFRAADVHAPQWERDEDFPRQHVQSFFERQGALWATRLATSGGVSGVSLLVDGSWQHRDLGLRRLVGSTAGGGPILEGRNHLYRMQPFSIFDEQVLRVDLPGRIEGVAIDRADDLWAWAAGDLHHIRDDGHPPDTTIVELAEEIPFGEEMFLRVRGYERNVPFDDVGALELQVRFDDGAWQSYGELDDGPVALTLPDVGRHVLAVRVVDAGGAVDDTPAIARFRVLPVPLQSRPWFGLALSAVFLAVLGLAAFGLVQRHRIAQQAQELARLVEVRTRALRGSEAQYRELFEESRDGILLCAADGRVLDANRSAAELFGGPESLPPGTNFSNLFDDALDLEHASESASSPLRLTRRGGQQHVFLSATARLDDSGRTIAHLVIARDVTLQVQLEEHLHHTQKMEAIGRMAGGIAHEFNNILTGILGYCELLEDEVPREVRPNVDVVREQALRAKELTGQIQSFSRVDVGSADVVEVNSVVARVERLLRPSLGHAVELELSLDPRVGRSRIDAGKLEQVIVNLALNAMDAMPDGGTLTISTRPSSADRRLAWAISVSDTGTGMSEETRRKVFEPFFTTKPSGRGTGLGLAIVYGIVDQVGGSIRIASTPGSGTTFEVDLPATREPVASVGGPPEHTVAPAVGARLLVVDDEGAIRSFLLSVLEREGYQVVLASSAEEALERWRESEADFDLLITDLVMPGRSGLELTEELRRAAPGLPVLLISGHPEVEGETPGTRLTGCMFLPKPFAPRQLLPLVSELLEAQRSRQPTQAPS